MIEIELVCLQIFLKGDEEDFKANMKFHKSIEKKEAIELLEMAIEELKEGQNENWNN